MSDTETPRSYAPIDMYDVLAEVADERRHQIDDCRWTPDHDDLHGIPDFAWLVARRAVDMCHKDAAEIVDARRLFVEISAISVAAIEAIDRKRVRREAFAPPETG